MSGGSSIRSSRWPSTSSSSRSSSRSASRDYPLFVFAAILPWKWFSSAVNDGIVSVTSRERIIKQVKFPKIVLPVAATVGGIVNFAFGLIPLFALMLLFYSDRISPYLVLIPVVAAVQFVFSLATAIAVSGDQRLLPRHRQRRPARPAAVVLPVAGALLVRPGRRARPARSETSCSRSTRGRRCSSPTAPSSTTRRCRPGSGSRRRSWSRRCVFLLLATLFFKRVEPAFAKVL